MLNPVQLAVSVAIVKVGDYLTTLALSKAADLRNAIIITRADLEVSRALLLAAELGKTTDKEGAIRQAKEIAETARERIRSAVLRAGVPLPNEVLDALADIIKKAAAALPGAVGVFAFTWTLGAGLAGYVLFKLLAKR